MQLFPLRFILLPAILSTGVHSFGIRARAEDGAWSLDNKWLFVKGATAIITTDIINAEYYIDTDPGFGKGTPVNITPGTNLSNLTAGINPAILRAGVHLFGVRAKDENGAWNLDNKWLFVKDTLQGAIPNIVRVEYYVDTDPGYGNATSATIITSSNLVDVLQNVQVGNFSDGVHLIGIRALDANGAWSLDNRLIFSISGGPLPLIISNLNGQYVNNKNKLTVEIQQALNVKEVQLEKSVDGSNFKYLGIIASGTITGGTYTYYDDNPVMEVISIDCVYLTMMVRCLTLIYYNSIILQNLYCRPIQTLYMIK